MSDTVLIVDKQVEAVELAGDEVLVVEKQVEQVIVREMVELEGEEVIVFDIATETIIVKGDEIQTFEMGVEVVEVHEGGPATTRIFQGPGASGLVPDPGVSTGRFLRDDGTWGSGGGGGGSTTFVEGEEPAGVVNGINAVFTLLQAPSPAASLHLFKSGLRMKRGLTNDYTLLGNTITFNSGAIPQPGMELTADYQV